VRRPQSFRDAVEQAGNAEETLLALLNAIILCNLDDDKFGPIDIRPGDHTEHTLRIMLRRLGGTSTTEPRIPHGLLDGLVFSKEWFAGQDLYGISVRRADLSDIHLYPARLTMGDLRGANLSRAFAQKAQFLLSHLEGAIVSHADLQEANLERAHLDGANLDGTKLTGAVLKNAYLIGASLEGAKLDGADLSEANLQQANLKNADLRNSNLERANLEGADLNGAKLDGANLTGAKTSQTILDGR
jgi:uncharacterized protein YjbI with pentapeptide repeats